MRARFEIAARRVEGDQTTDQVERGGRRGGHVPISGGVRKGV